MNHLKPIILPGKLNFKLLGSYLNKIVYKWPAVSGVVIDYD
jgi:hypothetical protein